MASIFKRGDTWWLQYMVDGRRVRESLETTNERIAIDRKREIEALGRLKQLRRPTSIPFKPFLEAFCNYLKATCTRDGYKTDLSRLRGFFGPCVPALQLGSHVPRKYRREPEPIATLESCSGLMRIPIRKLEDLQSLSISNNLAERVAEEEITGQTANKYREILQRMFNYAISQHGYVCPDRDRRHPVEAVNRFPEAEPEITWLTADAINEQLKGMAYHVNIHALVATYIYAGLRRAEALWLTDADVDFKRRLIYVRAKTVGGDSWKPKTGKNRVVPISETLCAIVTAYKAQRPAKRTPWFFPSTLGMRWDPDNFSQSLAEINAKAGLTWTCLDFRHTFGSHLAQQGMSLYKISKLMGNSPEVCRRHYAALVPEAMHDEVEFVTKHDAGITPPAGVGATTTSLSVPCATHIEHQGKGRPENAGRPIMRLVR
jgi:integrase